MRPERIFLGLVLVAVVVGFVVGVTGQTEHQRTVGLWILLGGFGVGSLPALIAIGYRLGELITRLRRKRG
jgi:hypothetical protein